MTLVSAPGKIMLAGEYAVLYGGRALAHTLDKRLKIEIRPTSSGITIFSQLWDNPKKYPQDHLDGGKAGGKEPVLDSIDFFLKEFGVSFQGDIDISSELTVSHGVGSSSALRVALFAALLRFHKLNSNFDDIANLAFGDQKRSQKYASGYDILTQMHGGAILLNSKPGHPWPPVIQKVKLPLLKLVQVWVGGQGAPTTSTIAATKKWLEENNLLDELIQLSENLVNSWLDQSEESLFQATHLHRQFFAKSPMYPKALSEILDTGFLSDRWTWKTTGAGGEDAILLMGVAPEEIKNALRDRGWHPAPYGFSEKGLDYND